MLNKNYLVMAIVVLVLFSTGLVSAGLPTQAQLDKCCVQVVLKVDGDVHNFYVPLITKFDEIGLEVKHGKHLEKRNFILRSEILNFDEAQEKYKRLRR